MARNLASGSSQYLEYNGAITTSVPLSIVAWYKPTTSNASAWLAGVYSSSAINLMALEINSSGQVQAFDYDGTTIGVAIKGTVTNGTWSHCRAVFTSHSNRTAYLDGASVNDTTGTPAPTGLDKTVIGAVYSGGSLIQFANGALADVAFYNVALTADDMAALAKGISPLLVRPSSLIAYYPLWGNDSPEPDRWKNRYDVATGNAPTKADHPRIYYPTGIWMPPYAAAAAASGTGNMFLMW